MVGDLGCCQAKLLTVTSPNRLMKLARKVSIAGGPGARPEGAARGGGLGADGSGGEREAVVRGKKQAGSSEGMGRGMLTGSRPGGRISFKQYLSVGLSCLR